MKNFSPLYFDKSGAVAVGLHSGRKGGVSPSGGTGALSKGVGGESFPFYQMDD